MTKKNLKNQNSRLFFTFWNLIFTFLQILKGLNPESFSSNVALGRLVYSEKSAKWSRNWIRRFLVWRLPACGIYCAPFCPVNRQNAICTYDGRDHDLLGSDYRRAPLLPATRWVKWCLFQFASTFKFFLKLKVSGINILQRFI